QPDSSACRRPRTTPFGYLSVISVTYEFAVVIWELMPAFSLVTPVWPEWHLLQSRTRIGPNWPGLPRWMSAITSDGLPRFEYVSLQLIWLPLAGITPLRAAFAFRRAGGTCHGLLFTVTTCCGVMVAVIRKFLAVLDGPALAPAGAASATAPSPTAITRILMCP